MSSRRTEEPTPRRLRRARALGEIATSRELTSTVALAAGLVAGVASAATTGRLLAHALPAAIGRALEPATEPWPALLDATVLLVRAAAPCCAAAAVGAAVPGAIQARGLLAPGAVRPRWDRLDLSRGLSRLFSAARMASVLVGFAKTALVLAVGGWAAGALAGAVRALPRLDATSLLARVPALGVRIALALAALGIATGALDLAVQARRHRRSLRMTREEVRRDHREDEGDPHRKAERRRLHRALAAAAPLRRAACVVVNPTHVAVALQHATGSDEAPVVLAKALGRGAADLRREARRAGIPIVRHVHLARALYRLAEIGEEIPVELYDAAAAVLAHVYGAREALP